MKPKDQAIVRACVEALCGDIKKTVLEGSEKIRKRIEGGEDVPRVILHRIEDER